MRQHSKATRASPKYVEPKQTKNLRDEIMCYEIEVLEYNEDEAIVTVGESKFIAYHDTEGNQVNVKVWEKESGGKIYKNFAINSPKKAEAAELYSFILGVELLCFRLVWGKYNFT